MTTDKNYETGTRNEMFGGTFRLSRIGERCWILSREREGAIRHTRIVTVHSAIQITDGTFHLEQIGDAQATRRAVTRIHTNAAKAATRLVR